MEGRARQLSLWSGDAGGGGVAALQGQMSASIAASMRDRETLSQLEARVAALEAAVLALTAGQFELTDAQLLSTKYPGLRKRYASADRFTPLRLLYPAPFSRAGRVSDPDTHSLLAMAASRQEADLLKRFSEGYLTVAGALVQDHLRLRSNSVVYRLVESLMKGVLGTLGFAASLGFLLAFLVSHPVRACKNMALCLSSKREFRRQMSYFLSTYLPMFVDVDSYAFLRRERDELFALLEESEPGPSRLRKGQAAKGSRGVDGAGGSDTRQGPAVSETGSPSQETGGTPQSGTLSDEATAGGTRGQGDRSAYGIRRFLSMSSFEGYSDASDEGGGALPTRMNVGTGDGHAGEMGGEAGRQKESPPAASGGSNRKETRRHKREYEREASGRPPEPPRSQLVASGTDSSSGRGQAEQGGGRVGLIVLLAAVAAAIVLVLPYPKKGQT